MNIIGKEMRKLEYVLDIFRGTCLLNNYTPASLEEELKTIVKTIDDGKYFYYKLDKLDNIKLRAFTKGKSSTLRDCELINLAVKILNFIGIEEVDVKIDTNDENIIPTLESIDIFATEDSLSKKECDTVFEIYDKDKLLGIGKINKKDNLSYFDIDYNAIKDLCDYHDKLELDAYIIPKDESVFDDAFIIATNLKDAGFQVEVDFEHANIPLEEISAAFLITFDEKDIANYKVHYKDLKTQEEREVMIDNIVEELSFF